MFEKQRRESMHVGEVIHQEAFFKAKQQRVYTALTDTEQFDKVTQLSEAMKRGLPPGAPSTKISPDAGGPFSLFGGYVVGRNVELVPNERIVQAWRTINWTPGTYSIVKFELSEESSGTKIVLEHMAFPVGQLEHLAAGWKANYWEPLEKFLA
jgi:activator of HSP90 ATPase